MKTRLYLYGFLILSVMVQVILMKRLAFFPDIVLLMVVFVGIFRDRSEGIVFGLAAGFIRGCFSVGTFAADILLFPFIAALSSTLGVMFYRQNAAVQMFITLTAIFAAIAAHTFYLNVVGLNDIGMRFVLFASWRHIAATVFLSPFVFFFMREVLRLQVRE